MTSQQKKSSIAFAVLTLVVFVVSLLLGKEVSQTDLNNVLKASQVIENSLVSTSPAPSFSADTQLHLVTRVIDGDTFELESGEKVRYIGIDTPELHHPQKGVECYGKEAAEFNKQLLENKYVRMESDVSNTDRYDRLLRYVWIEDRFINEYLVEQGYAVSSAYPPDIQLQELLDVAEQTARDGKRGLWQACQ